MTGNGGPFVAQIDAMLARRATGATLCPSEVARTLVREGGDWRALMGDVHAAVDQLHRQGRIVLSWRGERLQGRDGPYRIGAAP